MSEPTETDQDKAMDLVGLATHSQADMFGEMREAIAAALAEERAKARAPFLALADEYDLIPIEHAEARRIVRKTADRIRRAAEESE